MVALVNAPLTWLPLTVAAGARALAVVEVVAVVALPFRAAEIVPAEKLFEASRLTRVLGLFASVAPLAASVAVATLAALLPPTVETTVLDCAPVTSPARLPVKLPEPMSVQFVPLEIWSVLLVVLKMICPLLARAGVGCD